MTSFVVALVIVAIIGAASAYIIKEKKKGTRCIGCPAAGACSGAKGGSSCSCNCQSNTDN